MHSKFNLRTRGVVGIVLIVSVNAIEDRGFESLKGVRFLGLFYIAVLPFVTGNVHNSRCYCAQLSQINVKNYSLLNYKILFSEMRHSQSELVRTRWIRQQSCQRIDRRRRRRRSVRNDLREKTFNKNFSIFMHDAQNGLDCRFSIFLTRNKWWIKKFFCEQLWILFSCMYVCRYVLDFLRRRLNWIKTVEIVPLNPNINCGRINGMIT
jgi:hypothetical protein